MASDAVQQSRLQDFESAPQDILSADAARLRIVATDSIGDVEACWRVLEAHGIDSPGQSFDFNKTWIETFDVPNSEQVFLVAKQGEVPLALLALQRVTRFGGVVLTAFSGAHVGCHSPLLHRKRLAQMSPDARRDMWKQMFAAAGVADLIHIPDVMAEDALLAEMGALVASDTLYRSQFESWAQCDAEQRSRSRRKHDKQQAAKLAAMGEVSFETYLAEDAPAELLDVMFEDRAKRFAEQGIADPFAAPQVRAFYRSVFSQGRDLRGMMQVLRLDGRVVATRYNLTFQDRVFCLISSMNTDPALAPGSPGKQILVHAMRDMFDGDVGVFDMGAGFTDEKRHWCNIKLPLAHAYVPLTWRGKIMVALHGFAMQAKRTLKENTGLFKRLKSLRQRFSGKK